MYGKIQGKRPVAKSTILVFSWSHIMEKYAYLFNPTYLIYLPAH